MLVLVICSREELGRDVFAAILSAIGIAGCDITNKVLLSKWRLPIKQFIPFLFIILIFVSALVIPFGFRLDTTLAFSAKYVILFVLMIASAVIWNIFFYRSMQKETLHEFELIILMSPLVTVLLAGIFLPTERNLHIFIAGIVSTLALFLTRIKKHHLQFSKAASGAFVAVVFIAVEAVILKELLAIYSPAVLYFVRVVIISLVMVLIYKPTAGAIKGKEWLVLVISAMFGVLQMVFRFFAYWKIGVVETTMILLLGPVLTYIASYFYFREKKNFVRDALAAAVVIVAIVYVNIVK